MNKIIQIIFLLLLINLTIFGQEKKLDQVRFLAAGDLNLAHWITPILEKKGEEYPFKYIKDYMSSADLIFSNLEAPFCNKGEPYPKNFVFKVPEKYVNVLKTGNINLVSLANNHILDYGMPCLESTVQLLKKEKIHFAGAGINFGLAHKPAVFEINNIKFAFFAYSMTLPKYFFASDSTGGTAYPKRNILRDSISYYDNKVDYVIVSFHWGKELTEFPKEYQQNYARWAIDYGADLILGHHPHVLQGIEKYKNRIIAYSLANFIFASYSNKATDSIFLDLTFTKNKIIDLKIAPIYVNNYQIHFQPVIMKKEKKSKVIKYINQISVDLNNNKQTFTLDGKLNI